MPSEQYRGPITNRGLTSALNQRDGCASLGNLELLGLKLNDLVGKKILDVGIGGGRTLGHAIELGLDCFGLDVLPLIDATTLNPRERDLVLERQAGYADIKQKYPERVQAVNFCSTNIPYHQDEFDVVFSAGALPEYARTAREAALSILNMVNLARERVIFNSGWNEEVSPSGLIALGRVPVLFYFPMKQFLDDLTCTSDISYRIIDSIPPVKSPLVTNISIDTTRKNTDSLLDTYRKYAL